MYGNTEKRRNNFIDQNRLTRHIYYNAFGILLKDYIVEKFKEECLNEKKIIVNRETYDDIIKNDVL